MINLDIKGYCEECPHFEAVTTSHIVGSNGRELQVEHDITCSRKDSCEYAISHCFGGGK